MKNKNTREALDTTRSLIENIGPGFCAAKWYAATIWLSNGRTASCHHPLAHHVPTDELNENPSALHNTKFKKEQRKLMLEGKRPAECGYCWRVEDADNKQLSDRVYKSHIYEHDEIKKLTEISWDENINLKRLEISFDHLCNLSCTYCNSEFSSTWGNDIKKNGGYDNMKTSGGHTYREAYKFDTDPVKEENIYIKKFFEWWDSGLKDSLEELRITGGEPSRSPHFWKFVENCDDEKFIFSVNSNLQMDELRIKKLIDCSHNFRHFELFTSGESHGKFGEFVRHGLEYDTWLTNIRKFADEGKYVNIHNMMTISAMSLFGITDFLDDIVTLKKEYNNATQFHLSVNILRFPSYQSVNILPLHIKSERAMAIEQWLNSNRENITADEVAHIERLVSYLLNIDKSYEDQDSYEDKTNDFYHFFSQYANRRGINILDLFKDYPDFIEWWGALANGSN